MLKRNEEYAGYDILKNMGMSKDSNKYPIMHSFFYVEGEYPFGELKLIRYGWNKIHSTNEEIQVIASVQDKKKFDFSDEDYKKDLIFESKRDKGLIVIQLNTKTHYHEIEISANKNKDENPGIIKRAKFMLERELRCTLKDRYNPVSSLTDKLEQEEN